MSLIDVVNLTFAHEGSYDNVFENISFQIDTQWRLGFTGRNGRGKTTFLNLLLGEYEYSGKINTSVSFKYFPLPINDKEKTPLEIADEILVNYENWQLIKELNLLSVDTEVIYRPYYTLSNGEQTKVMLAILFLKDNSFLLIDEPTNHLDREARNIVAKYLNNKEGFILVSHDRNFLDSCTTHTLSINKTNIEIEKGSFSSWWQNKERRDQFELMENQRLKAEIKQLTSAVKRTAKWSDKVEKTKYSGKADSGLKPDKGHVGHMAAKMMKRSKAIELRRNTAVEDKELLLKNIEQAEDLKLMPMPYHSDILIRAENLTVFYGDKEVLKDISFTVKRGDRLSINGKNGSGKSSIIRLLLGGDISYTGNLYIGSRLKTSYLPQDTSMLKGSLKDFTAENNIDEALFKAILRKMDFERVQFEKNIEDYSQGQKKKVLIAKSLCESANIYLWDEPLNYIDIYSRIQIEELLLKYAPTMIFVEHDMEFEKNIATDIIYL